LHRFQQLLCLDLRVGLVAGDERAGDTVADVVVEDLEGEALERGVDGADLGQDVDAVAVLLDLFSTPRTWPSIRCRRLISASLFLL
jgi:hypothetical protein